VPAFNFFPKPIVISYLSVCVHVFHLLLIIFLNLKATHSTELSLKVFEVVVL